MEDPKDRFPAMLADKIDMIASTVDTGPVSEETGPVQIRGRDRRLQRRRRHRRDEGHRKIADLKGKSVAVSEGSVSEFYLNVLLGKAGLKESDLKTVNMAAPEAGAAFVAKKVDAAVTWEPWLSRGKKTDFGHLLVDSSSTPGLITDVITTTKDYVTKHPKETKGVVDAWNEAVAFARANPDEANVIMAKGVGGWLKDPKVFGETLEGIKFYGAEDNKVFFGTKEKPGPLAHTVQDAIDIWSSHGKLQVKITPNDIIDYSFVNG